MVQVWTKVTDAHVPPHPVRFEDLTPQPLVHLLAIGAPEPAELTDRDPLWRGIVIASATATEWGNAAIDTVPAVGDLEIVSHGW